MKSKAETFVGFAVRAGKIRTGQNTLATVKRIFLVIICKTASQNAVKNAEKYARKHGCPLYVTENAELAELIHKDGVKIAAITDKSLAKAITDNAAPDLKRLEVPNKSENSDD